MKWAIVGVRGKGYIKVIDKKTGVVLAAYEVPKGELYLDRPVVFNDFGDIKLDVKGYVEVIVAPWYLDEIIEGGGSNGNK